MLNRFFILILIHRFPAIAQRIASLRSIPNRAKFTAAP